MLILIPGIQKVLSIQDLNFTGQMKLPGIMRIGIQVTSFKIIRFGNQANLANQAGPPVTPPPTPVFTWAGMRSILISGSMVCAMFTM